MFLYTNSAPTQSYVFVLTFGYKDITTSVGGDWWQGGTCPLSLYISKYFFMQLRKMSTAPPYAHLPMSRNMDCNRRADIFNDMNGSNWRFCVPHTVYYHLWIHLRKEVEIVHVQLCVCYVFVLTVRTQLLVGIIHVLSTATSWIVHLVVIVCSDCKDTTTSTNRSHHVAW